MVNSCGANLSVPLVHRPTLREAFSAIGIHGLLFPKSHRLILLICDPFDFVASDLVLLGVRDHGPQAAQRRVSPNRLHIEPTLLVVADQVNLRIGIVGDTSISRI